MILFSQRASQVLFSYEVVHVTVTNHSGGIEYSSDHQALSWQGEQHTTDASCSDWTPPCGTAFYSELPWTSPSASILGPV